MTQPLIDADKWLFLFLNSSFHWAPIDVVMMWLSEVKHFYLIYALLLAFLFWKGGTQGRCAVFVIIITILLTDQISAHFIKPLVERMRPCHELAGVVNLGGCGEGYSFPSTHATNMFALAVVLASYFSRRKYYYYLFAFLVAYSRIHLGVHYPLDIIGGAVFGMCVAWCVVRTINLVYPHRERIFGAVALHLKAFRNFLGWAVVQRYTLPIVSGILLGLAFPPVHSGITAAFGLVPLLFAIELDLTRSKFATFRVLYVSFFIFHAIANYWIGGWGNNVDPFLMIACVALMIVHPLFFSVPMCFYVGIRKRLGLLPALFALPFLWTVFEYLHSIGDLGYPWLTLGNSQTYYTEGIQFIEYTGIYGVSFLLVAQNAILFLVIKRLRKSEAGFFRKEIILPMMLLGIMLIIPALHGEWIFREHDMHPVVEKTFRTAIIQPNIDPLLKWSGVDEWNQVLEMQRLSIAALKQKPDVVIWPETAVPIFLNSPLHLPQLRQLHSFVDSCNVPLITGFIDDSMYSAQPPAPLDANKINGGYEAAYNADMLMEPHTNVLQTYHKMRLVPFAERTPFISELPFLAHLIQWSVGLSGWSKGTDYTTFDVTHNNDSACIWSMICYESVYPSFVRGFVDSGATALAVITNDGWYGRSPGPVQHQQYAVLRAIENRRAIARCANTGISCFIDKYGNINQRTQLFSETTIIGDIALNTDKTFYTLHGDLLAWLCCGVGVIFIMFFVREIIR